MVPKWLIQTLKDSGMTKFTSWIDTGPRTRSQHHSVFSSADDLLQTEYSLLSLFKGAKEEVYVSQPPSSVVPCKKEYGYRWFKALYSLKQTPRAWIEKMNQYLKKQKFIRSQAVFFPTEGDRLCSYPL